MEELLILIVGIDFVFAMGMCWYWFNALVCFCSECHHEIPLSPVADFVHSTAFIRFSDSRLMRRQRLYGIHRWNLQLGGVQTKEKNHNSTED